MSLPDLPLFLRSRRMDFRLLPREVRGRGGEGVRISYQIFTAIRTIRRRSSPLRHERVTFARGLNFQACNDCNTENKASLLHSPRFFFKPMFAREQRRVTRRKERMTKMSGGVANKNLCMFGAGPRELGIRGMYRVV